MTDAVTPFGAQPDGAPIRRLRISGHGLTASVLTRGAILQELRLEGHEPSLCLGSPDPAAYLGPLQFHGPVCGPVVNRIRGASAEVGGEALRFEANDGTSCLHGGSAGFHGKLWEVAEHDATGVTLTLDAPHGEGGFPGNRRITASYRILAPSTLEITLSARTDRLTPISLAHHGYWNLDGTPTWAGHRLQVMADRYLPTTPDLVTTGEVRPVEGTAFDFRTPRLLEPGKTPPLDTNFCLADGPRALAPALVLEGRGGLRMEVSTTAPGVQVYDGERLGSGPHRTHSGRRDGQFAGLAVEPQHWPGALHNRHFPPVLLAPGAVWEQVSRFRFAG